MSTQSLSDRDSQFLAYLRGIAILAIIFLHLGGWLFRPYSEFLCAFVPVFFFLSGSVSYYSYKRSATTSEYLRKRLIGLLVPYYLLAVFCLAVYVCTHAAVPPFSAHDVLRWLTIRPTPATQGFPIGQVWFLHTLVIISIMSPLYFRLYERSPWLLVPIVGLPMMLSVVQCMSRVSGYCCLAGNNLYQPLVSSVFYIFGFFYFSSTLLRKKTRLVVLAGTCVMVCVASVATLDLSVDLEAYHSAPNLYYVLASSAIICGFLVLQDALLQVTKRVPALAAILRFMHRYTFPIYLLHSFGIWVSEGLGLVNAQGNYIQYAIAKLTVVMVVTCTLAIPFGAMSTWLTKRVLDCCIGTRRHCISPATED
jgi:hypothetical protein